MALADFDDFTVRHPGEYDETVIAALLDDASDLILEEVAGSESDWVGDAEAGSGDTPIPQGVVGICVAVAFRAFRNPDALSMSQLGEAIYRWRDDVPDALYLTDREKARLQSAAGGSTFKSVPLESPWSGPTTEDLTITGNDLFPIP